MWVSWTQEETRTETRAALSAAHPHQYTTAIPPKLHPCRLRTYRGGEHRQDVRGGEQRPVLQARAQAQHGVDGPSVIITCGYV